MKQRTHHRYFLTGLVLATLGSALFAARSGSAETLLLNGLWEVAAGSPDRPPKTFPHTAPVPGFLDQAEPEFAGVGRLPDFWSGRGQTPPDYGWFWYRRPFDLPDELPPSVRLVIHKAAFGTEAERRAFRARVNAMVTEFWRTARTSAAVMNFEGLSFPGPVEGLPGVLHNTSSPVNSRSLTRLRCAADAVLRSRSPDGYSMPLQDFEYDGV